MSDIYARQRQLIGTTAEWSANDLVIGSGEIAVEVATGGTIKMKVGNGVSVFSALPYVTGSAAGDYLPIAGGSLEGPLYFNPDDVTSTMRMEVDSSASGDYFGMAVQAGGDAGIQIVSRDSAGPHTLQWTRKGVLVLRHQNPNINDFMGIQVDTFNGQNSLVFEHTDADGNEVDQGSFVFKTDNSPDNSVIIGVGGNVSITGTPNLDTHLITREYADARYALISEGGGITQSQADARYLRLAGGTMTDGFFINPPDVTSTIRLDMTNESSGDVFGIAVQSGGNAGINFVSRGSDGGAHSLQWTRKGVLVLRHQDSNINDFMGIQVDTFNGQNSLIFEHTDADGNELNQGSFVFKTDNSPANSVVIGTGGNISITGTPNIDTHLITRGYADSRYALNDGTTGITQGQADARYVKLSGSTMTGALSIQPSGLSKARIQMLTDSAGDYLNTAIVSGGNAGMKWVTRAADNEPNVMQWTRNGMLVLSNNDNTDYMGINVAEFGGISTMFFQHTNSDGTVNNTGGLFSFAGSSGSNVAINEGIISCTDDPFSGTHIGNRNYNDTRYLRGNASDTFNGTLNLTAGNRNTTLQTYIGTASSGEFVQNQIKSGDNAGMKWLTRGAGGTAHTMQWTRNGMFVLSNNQSTDFMGIQVTRIANTYNQMTFTHTNSDGSPDGTGGFFTFYGGTNQNVSINAGIVSATGVPAAGTHLMTRQACDNRYVSSSDRNLKKNIKQDIGDALNKLMALTPVSFQYKKNTDAKLYEMHEDHYGLIAQDVLDILPSLVYKKDETEDYGLDYVEIVPLLVKAVQQLNNKLEAI